jgi:hypothetical protein
MMSYCNKCHKLIYGGDGTCWQCSSRQADSAASEAANPSVLSPSPPQFATPPASPGKGAKRNKRYLIVAILFGLLLLAREGGFLNWYLFRFNTYSQSESSFYGEQYIQSGDRYSYSQFRKNLDHTSTTRSDNSGVAFSAFSESPLMVDLQEEIQKKLDGQTQVTALLEEIEITGDYWQPIFKVGKCKYQVRMKFTGKDSIVYTGNLKGETSFDLTGLCSVRKLKETLGDDIASSIIKAVDSHVRK